MRQFFTLYRFELKKIFQKWYVSALLTLCVASTIFLNVRPLLDQRTVAYVDGQQQFHFGTITKYEAFQLERRFAREDAGTLLDNEAAWAMRKMYRQYQEIYNQYTTAPTCVLLNHYLIFRSMYNTGINPVAKEVEYPADFAYQTMEEHQTWEFSFQQLTQEEIEYWERERSRLTTPFTIAYAGGYEGILEKAYWLNLMALVFALVSLCGSFSDDDVYKTRPLLTSSVHGRLPLTLVRLAAGVSLACGCVLLLFGLTAAIQFFVHGVSGARMPIQLLRLEEAWTGAGTVFLSDSCRVMTAGQAVLAAVGMSLLIALFAGALSILLSKLLRRAVPALALPMGLLLFSLYYDTYFYDQDRVRAQIWSYMPVQRLSQKFLLDERLVSLGGVQLDCIPVSVLLYGGLAAAALVTCVWLCKVRAVDKT